MDTSENHTVCQPNIKTTDTEGNKVENDTNLKNENSVYICRNIKANHPLLSKHYTEQQIIDENKKLKATRAKKQQQVNELYVRNLKEFCKSYGVGNDNPIFPKYKISTTRYRERRISQILERFTKFEATWLNERAEQKIKLNGNLITKFANSPLNIVRDLGPSTGVQADRNIFFYHQQPTTVSTEQNDIEMENENDHHFYLFTNEDIDLNEQERENTKSENVVNRNVANDDPLSPEMNQETFIEDLEMALENARAELFRSHETPRPTYDDIIQQFQHEPFIHPGIQRLSVNQPTPENEEAPTSSKKPTVATLNLTIHEWKDKTTNDTKIMRNLMQEFLQKQQAMEQWLRRQTK